MEYPDEINVNEQEFTQGFDVEDKINAMLGQRESKVNNSQFFERGDKLLMDLPVINTEEKIRQMLDF